MVLFDGGVCKQSRWRHSVTEPSQDGGYVLLWQRYDNNKMVAMLTILHLQQYSHRLNFFWCVTPQTNNDNLHNFWLHFSTHVRLRENLCPLWAIHCDSWRYKQLRTVCRGFRDRIIKQGTVPPSPTSFETVWYLRVGYVNELSIW